MWCVRACALICVLVAMSSKSSSTILVVSMVVNREGERVRIFISSIDTCTHAIVYTMIIYFFVVYLSLYRIISVKHIYMYLCTNDATTIDSIDTA